MSHGDEKQFMIRDSSVISFLKIGHRESPRGSEIHPKRSFHIKQKHAEGN